MHRSTGPRLAGAIDQAGSMFRGAADRPGQLVALPSKAETRADSESALAGRGVALVDVIDIRWVLIIGGVIRLFGASMFHIWKVVGRDEA